MGQAIPRQHPAVVLRSHFNQLRALLAVAMIAVVGLTAAVVILATDDQSNPSVAPATAVSMPAPADGIRYDGGLEEGTSGAVHARQPTVTPATEIKDEASIAAAIGQSNVQSELRGSKASDFGNSQYRLPEDGAPKTRYDGGPEEGTALSGQRP
jgi:hypothetical protein